VKRGEHSVFAKKLSSARTAVVRRLPLRNIKRNAIEETDDKPLGGIHRALRFDAFLHCAFSKTSQLLLWSSNQGIVTTLRAVSGIQLNTAYSLAVIPAQQTDNQTINRHILRITEDDQILPTCDDALFN
jgi:hypothetical protein